jgi:ketosteroid isomerase-like protein
VEAPDLAARLDRLEQERAVVAVLTRYCHAIDGGLRDAWLDCFTEDGVFAFDGRGSYREVSGREELARWFDDHKVRYPLGELNHVLANPAVTVEGERAGAVSYFITLAPGEAGTGSGVAVASNGRYTDTLRRCADGAWRIERREARRDLP